MNSFNRAGSFYSDAFQDQSEASSMQKAQAPVNANQFEKPTDFLEEMKRDMLTKAAVARRTRNEEFTVRAGNGSPTESVG